jgi:predicted small secreted protein
MRHIHALGLISSLLFALSACTNTTAGDGTARDALTEGAGEKPEPPACDPPSTEGCESGTLAGFSCTDGGELKTQAYLACDAAGLQLVGLDLDTSACNTESESVSAVYTCCPAPPAPDPSCFDLGLGDGTSCHDVASYKEQANAACESKGSVLADLWAAADGCTGGEATKIGFTCCVW